jgi:hypothetical protein
VTAASPARTATAAKSPDRPSAGLTNALIRELATWLETPDLARIRDLTPQWRPETWGTFRRVVTMHGLASHLAHDRSSSGLAEVMPADVRDWLAEQDRLNGQRIRRMHDELAAILARASAEGIAVMPLKGALLTTTPGVDPYRRPMSDLDLLVHPPDRDRMRAIVEALGYRHEPERNPRPTHDVFVDAGGGRVVSDGEHPDNPRRVEIHVEVKRHLWAWVNDDDLTDALWAGSHEDEVVGQRAIVPRPESLFAHLAIHASSDLLVARGRLMQWLDLGVVASRVGSLAGLPHPRVAYPSLRLATRALPGQMSAIDLGEIEPQVPRRLARWAATVPLDGHCGLTTGRPPDAPSGWGARFERWSPVPWRLAVAYGALPLPLALARHGVTIVDRALHRLDPASDQSPEANAR